MWKKLSDQKQEVKNLVKRESRKKCKCKRQGNTMKKLGGNTGELNANGNWKKKKKRYFTQRTSTYINKYDHYTLYAVEYIAKSLFITAVLRLQSQN